MTTELVRLSGQRVPVVAMETRPPEGSELVEFADGTRLLLNVRDGSVALRRLERQMPAEGIFLERIRPLIGSFWYRLWFSAPREIEILARVVQADPPLLGQDPSPRVPPRRATTDQR